MFEEHPQQLTVADSSGCAPMARGARDSDRVEEESRAGGDDDGVAQRAEEDVTADDDDDDDVSDGGDDVVLLGFVQKPSHDWSLARHRFPSKVGGAPAYLDPLNLPCDPLLCDFCSQPLRFLLQVYSPLDAEPSAFHRALFLFACRHQPCLARHQQEQQAQLAEGQREGQGNEGEGKVEGADGWARERRRSVCALRSQLPRSNPFYAFTPPPPDTPGAPLSKQVAMCEWCGTWKGSKRCGGCRQVNYCSKEHQKEHWRAGHSAACPRTPPPTSAAPSAPHTPPPAVATPPAPSHAPSNASAATDTSAARTADAESAGVAAVDVAEADWRVSVLDRGGWKEWEMVVEEEPEEGEEGRRGMRGAVRGKVGGRKRGRREGARCGGC
ncbi:hypothetical protein CLOM_g4220 [Closterium sp. NIES-68]|nr:hypothetical protein CLOM_g4220 [Closterium sp. NIES-68]